MAFDFTLKHNLTETLAQIRPASEAVAVAARERWNSLAKPLYSMGLLEEDICRIAAAQGTAAVKLTSPVW